MNQPAIVLLHPEDQGSLEYIPSTNDTPEDPIDFWSQHAYIYRMGTISSCIVLFIEIYCQLIFKLGDNEYFHRNGNSQHSEDFDDHSRSLMSTSGEDI